MGKTRLDEVILLCPEDGYARFDFYEDKGQVFCEVLFADVKKKENIQACKQRAKTFNQAGHKTSGISPAAVRSFVEDTFPKQ